MRTVSNGIGAGGVRPPAMVKVWDPFVRIFHWSLACLFVLAYATGDEIARVHIAAGYAIAGLLAIRIIWGFVGPRHARFSKFVRPPREVLAYLRDLALLRAPRYIGHNPAGGAMILALMIALAGTCATGYMMTTDAYWGSKLIEHVHEFLANLNVGLVVAHVLGVVIASFEHRENLVASMISGRKRAAD
ncbi:cytochrome b/b6 domain-containing protein [Bradyrhizobium guangzhouense]|uniref:Cytochrome B n=1 Tax=Bradyrhizobium guangzhouense TaxID=1325095 RepID=A0AAE5X1F9_9BRAD|nr:cytochrome b/b6 domain-containing protein [Bradyrhizobium guangzhouense]QAU47102.1 cytochrome B [Bradyrhizobium guangzhouense]RXH11217.1 cytochrome B [Bradyrhizobium guangzhouense]